MSGCRKINTNTSAAHTQTVPEMNYSSQELGANVQPHCVRKRNSIYATDDFESEAPVGDVEKGLNGMRSPSIFCVNEKHNIDETGKSKSSFGSGLENGIVMQEDDSSVELLNRRLQQQKSLRGIGRFHSSSTIIFPEMPLTRVPIRVLIVVSQCRSAISTSIHNTHQIHVNY